jgi:hypothetical protein
MICSGSHGRTTGHKWDSRYIGSRRNGLGLFVVHDWDRLLKLQIFFPEEFFGGSTCFEWCIICHGFGHRWL